MCWVRARRSCACSCARGHVVNVNLLYSISLDCGWKSAPPAFRPPTAVPLSQRKPRRRAAAAAIAAMDGMRGADASLMRYIRSDPRDSARRAMFHVYSPTAWSHADRSVATVPDPVERMSAMERAHCPWGA